MKKLVLATAAALAPLSVAANAQGWNAPMGKGKAPPPPPVVDRRGNLSVTGYIGHRAGFAPAPFPLSLVRFYKQRSDPLARQTTGAGHVLLP